MIKMVADYLGSPLTDVRCFQYADDTTIYDHAKLSDLNSCRNTLYQSINKLSVWSKESTLTFNNDKTKVMILSTPQMSRVHHLDEYDPNIAVSGYKLERIKSCKLLGVHVNEHLKWHDHINHTVSGCYTTLSILRKLEYLAKYELRKQLAETLILSKLDNMPIWFFTLYHNSYFAVCNRFNLLPQVLHSVTMLRTFEMFLKSDGFQSMREEI